MRWIKECFLLLVRLVALDVAACPIVSAESSHSALPPPHPALRAAMVLVQAVPAESGRHGELFDLINLIILVVVLIYVLRKPVGQFFRQHSDDIRKSLEEGRRALAAAQNQLAAAEAKLRRLEQEIAALKDSATREMAAERERMRKAAEEETERILASARSMIHSATQAAKLELRGYAVRQATELAEKMIRDRFNEQDQTRLVNRFLQGIPSGEDGKQSTH
jgi:F-type H+-transporting ATPase subunit b